MDRLPLVGIGLTKAYEQNVGYLKHYADDTYRLIHMRSVRVAGLEERNPAKRERRSGCDADKSDGSLSRTRSAIWELAICNPWDYFVTLTLDPERRDRYDLNLIAKQLGKFINNYNFRTDAAVKYLLIPEHHRDGAIHFHGLLSGLPPSHLAAFKLSDKIPARMKSMLREGRQLYDWPAYAKSFGFTSLETIRSPERCAAYMTKYITKELGKASVALNHHLYYCSKGLKRAEVLYRGAMVRSFESPDFANDYVRIKQFSDVSEAMSYFCDDMEE